MGSKKTICAGIEFGGNGVKVVIAETNDSEKNINFISCAEQTYKTGTKAMIKGKILNLEDVTETTRAALENAVDKLTIKKSYISKLFDKPIIDNYFFAISGNHINTSFITSIKNFGTLRSTVEQSHLNELSQELQNNRIGNDNTIIHNLERRFFIDNQVETLSILNRLATNYKQENTLIYGDKNTISDFYSILFSLTAVRPLGFSFSPIADFFAIRNELDVHMNCMIINIGESITEYALFDNGRCQYAGKTLIGCRHAINDLSIGFNMSYASMAKMFKEYGCVDVNLEHQNDKLLIADSSSVVGKNVSINRYDFELILKCRFEELFKHILEDVESKLENNKLYTKIYLTGGGALVKEIKNLAYQTFNKNSVEIATINNKSFPENYNNPLFTTVAGLIVKSIDDENLQELGFFEQLKQDLSDWLKSLLHFKS